MLAAGLLAACGGSDSGNDVLEGGQIAAPRSEIRVTSNVNRILEGTRATTYNDAEALQTEAHFTCMAYEANTTTTYISETTVDWNSTAWQFNNGASHYYWPLPATNGGAWPSLDFFAYMPAAANLSTYASYIGSITYTADHNVTFACTSLPMTNAGQGSSLKEFMFGVATGQNYGNADASGVTLNFQHPFARIKLQLAANHSDVTINSITFKGIKNNGSYNYNGSPQWTTSGDATDFVLTLTDAAAVFDNNPATPTQIGEYYIMIPQEWDGDIEVNASWNDWGDTPVAHTMSTTIAQVEWLPGYSYTYTFSIKEDDLTVNLTNFTEQW